MGGGYVDPYGFSKSGKSSSGGGGGSSGGYVDPYGFGKAKAAPKPQHHGGGGIGGFFHSVGHFVGSKAGLAAHDIEGIPGGTYHLVRAALPTRAELEHPLRFNTKSAKQQWGSFLTHPVRNYQETVRGKYGKEAQGAAGQAGGLIAGTEQAIRHPGRDPFATALILSPVLHGVGKAAEIGGAGRAARTLRMGGKEATLLKSRNAGARMVQRGYDRMLQRALDREAAGKPVGRVGARVAKHGAKRVQGALREEGRIQERMRLVPAQMLDHAAGRLSRVYKGKMPSAAREEQAALELTSVQTPAEEAAAYHYAQARKGVNPKQNTAVAKLYERVAKRGLVHVDESLPAGAKVHINPAMKKLAATDAALARVQKRGDTILAKHEIMTPQELEQRTNAPARIRAGATYEKPTPGKAGVPSDKLQMHRAYVNRLQRLSDRANERVKRLEFTAADRKRIGNMSAPVDAAALREQLRPLDKRLRQLTEEWNAPAKAGGRMTEAEAQARFAELDKQYQELIDKMVPRVSPYGGKITKAETARRNVLRAKAGKGKYRAVRASDVRTVKEEERQLAEQKIHEVIARNPEHPSVKKGAEVIRERAALHKALYEGMPGEPLDLPATGGMSPYEARARIHRVLRKGTTAEKAIKGTEMSVSGLNDLKEQAAELTDRINELRGTPGPAIKELRKRVAEIRKAIRDAEAPRSRVISGERPRVISPNGDVVRPTGAVRADRIGAALSVAKDRLQQLEAAAERRQKPTGIIGGETARPGRGFVSERVSQKRLARAEAASSSGPVTGLPREPIDKKPYTGRALEHGLRPKSVTRAASHHLRQIVRFENTDALRRTAVETGSDVRRSTRDVLIRVPDEQAGKLGADIRQVLGQETSTIDTPEELAATQEGLAAAHRMFAERILDRAATSKNDQVGVKAPDGYRWVDQNVIRGLQEAARPRGGPGAGLGRAVDNVNSAVTALTVYFKVGHIGTRVLTNATTNLIQGSLNPLELGRSYKLWEALSPEERARTLSASGQHGFAALPHEGTEGAVGKAVSTAASGGARWWARHADAPFRFNSIAYELRKSGYTTAADVKRALDGLETGGKGMPAHEWSKVSAAARRADREAIAYDRLNDFERRYLTRGVWFYPWVKGSTLFTMRTFLEHPFKAALIGQLGVSGRKAQEKALGQVPSYEEGLIALSGGKHPMTTDLSTFSPFATAADILNVPRLPGAVAEQFNPALGSAGQFAYGLNAYGAPSTNPYRDALLALFAPTPEQQIAESIAARHQDQSKRMFHKTPLNVTARFLLGPATPRRVNRAALARAAARERSGQR